jgi:hypothetical protein
MKDIICILIIMLLCIIGLVQRGSSENLIVLPKPEHKSYKHSKQHKKVQVKDNSTSRTVHFDSPVSVQILTGTQGIGADVKYGFLPKLSGRAGFGIIPLDASRGFGIAAFPIEGQLSTRFFNVHLLADYSPFNTTFFRFVGGAAYFINGHTHVLVSPTEGYTIGNQAITKDQFGTIQATATWKGVAPYLGVALFKSFPERRFNIIYRDKTILG